MVIDRSSWHYRLQDMFFRYSNGTEEELKGICGYFWMTAICMVLFVLVCMVVICSTLFSYLISPLFGYYPRKFGLAVVPAVKYETDEIACGLRERREFFRIRGVRIYLYQLLLALFVGWLIFHHLSVIVIGGAIFAAVFVPWAIYILVNRVRSKETWILIREYLKAVMKHICPIIEYRGTPPGGKTQ